MDVNNNSQADNDTSNSSKGDFLKVVDLFDQLTTKENRHDKLRGVIWCFSFAPDFSKLFGAQGSQSSGS